MRRLLLCAVLIACAYATDPDIQIVKAVKGGHSSYQTYKGGDTSRFYNSNNYTQQGYAGQQYGSHSKFDVGVCYKEVPTASLVKDPSRVPTGNGSRSDLSRIRACCEGYKRNIHNFLICDPICKNECVNGLCIAPDTCSCFPDHVRNLAGFCVATCPIGCQNGHCSGGECLCNEGFKLDRDSKFCLPRCRSNCGGVGNCTAPNTCTCNPGYTATPDGSCQSSGAPTTNTGCTGGACADNGNYIYRCPPGYSLKDSRCFPECNGGCGSDARCVLPNMCSAYDSVHTMVPYRIPNYNQNPSNGPNQNNNQHPNQGSNYPQYPYNQNQSNSVYPQSPNAYPRGPNQSHPHNGQTYPQTNQIYPSNGPNQNNNNYYNPNQGSLYPQYPYNQNQPSANPMSTNAYPQGQNQSHPSNNGQINPQNTQAHRYPASPLPTHQTTTISPYPSKPITYNITYPAVPLYPASQVGSNSTGYSHGEYAPNNQPTQRPDSNQGTYPLYPSLHNETYPVQYPQYPPNQFNPSQPGSYPYPQQNQYPQYPSNQQGLNTTYHSQYPQHGSQYPSNQHENNYPYSQYPQYNQYPYDQSSQTLQCSEPCVNGVCMGANRCRCHPGFIPDENDSTGNRCKPNCPGGCPNGYCEAPHTCACDEGYFKDTSVKGRAVCAKRIRRSAAQPADVGDLLVFKIQDYILE